MTWNSKRYWKEEAEKYERYYREKCRELENFREAVYEKETVTSIREKMRELQNNLDVSWAKEQVLRETNENLLQALNNLSKK